MQYISTSITDKGILKDHNEDSVVLIEATIEKTNVVFSSICDGMGGLQDGEIASTIMASYLEKWFYEQFESVYKKSKGKKSFQRMLYASLAVVVIEAAKEIDEYADAHPLTTCGTTVTMLLIVENRCYLMNIGDSRIYLQRKHLMQLTHDHTVLQKKLDKEAMSEWEMECKNPSSVLTRCICSGRMVPEPDFFSQIAVPGDIFMLCSDGFRHKVSSEEFERVFKKENPKTTAELSDIAHYLVELNKERKEKDNISCILIRCITEE